MKRTKKSSNPHASYHVADGNYFYVGGQIWSLEKSERALYSYADARGVVAQIETTSGKSARIVAERA